MILRIASFVLFLGAAFRSFGWFVTADALDALGLVALGLAAFVLSGLPLPHPPA